MIHYFVTGQRSGSFQYVEDNQDEGFQLPIYDLDTILLACNNFSERNKIGQGGFGSVYKVTHYIAPVCL